MLSAPRGTTKPKQEGAAFTLGRCFLLALFSLTPQSKPGMVVREAPACVPEPTKRCNGINARQNLPLRGIQRFKRVFVFT
jgi:hypothetical protein